MRLRQRRQRPGLRAALRRPRSLDDFNDLYLGPGGQLVDIDEQGNALPTPALPEAPPDEATGTFGLDISFSITASSQPTGPALSPSSLDYAATTPPSVSSVTASSVVASSTIAMTTSISLLQSVPSSTYLSASSASLSIAPSSSVLLTSASSFVASTASSSALSSDFSTSITASSTASSTTQSISSATSSPVSSSSSAPTPTGSAVNAAALSSRHPATFYLGIVLGSIVGFACLVAFVAWLLRVCTRRDKHDLGYSEPWPWDKDNRDHHLESGFEDPHGLDEGRWPVHDMLAEPKPPTEYSTRDAFGIQYPTGAIMKNGELMGTPKNPMLHQDVNGPLHPALQGTPKSMRTPFIPVPGNSHQSVPDLAADIGRLQVTNHMPGDVVSSGDEGSRANSRQGVDGTRMMTTPMQVNRDHGVMMNVPLTPRQIVTLQPSMGPSLPLPGQTQRKASEGASSQRSVGWAASIRSNLASAYHAVVGNQTSGSSAGDLLSHSHKGAYASAGHSDSIQQDISESPGQHAYDGSEIPVVRLDADYDSGQGDWDDLSAWMTTSRFTPLPTTSAPRNSRQTPVHPALTPGSPMVNSANPSPSPVPLSLCRSTTSESMQPAQDRRQTVNALRRSRKAKKRSPNNRPPLPGRMSSLSVGSEMSRASSTSSGPLTEQEKFAKAVLRERRRRVLGMRAGGGAAEYQKRWPLVSPRSSPFYVSTVPLAR